VRQVGYLLELFRDARSPEYKKNLHPLEMGVFFNGSIPRSVQNHFCTVTAGVDS
jgi:hypothetical protein